MEYSEQFEKDFIERTWNILGEYNGEYDATLLINCLLGLLILPKERFFDQFSDLSLDDWNIDPSKIQRCTCDYAHTHTPDVKQLLWQMRNAVAHFDVKPEHSNGCVTGFTFKNRSKFEANFTNEEIKNLVEKLVMKISSV